jgi:hypothetical protein
MDGKESTTTNQYSLGSLDTRRINETIIGEFSGDGTPNVVDEHKEVTKRKM